MRMYIHTVSTLERGSYFSKWKVCQREEVMGEGLIRFYHTKIKREWKMAFAVAFFCGLLIHIYKFTNTLPGHDSLFNVYSSQNMVKSGRWFLAIACGFSSYFDLPWIDGLFSLF